MRTKIITPKGFRLLADIKVGDQICNPDGTTARVIAIHQQGLKQFYRVTLEDGSFVETTADHKWVVSFAGRRRRRKKDVPIVPEGLRQEDEWNLRVMQRCRVVTTKQLIDIIEREKGRASRAYMPQLPLTAPVCFTTPIGRWKRMPPYTLGALLGDGYLNGNSISITSADEEIINRIKKELGDSYRVKKYGKIENSAFEYKIVGTVGQKTDSPQELLRRDKLLGTHSHNKFIPERIKKASVADRFAFIQGLFDTDGYMDSRGHTDYTTVSEQLGKDVQWMARSLGYRATLTTKESCYIKNGEKILGRLAYRLYIRGPHQEKLFYLKRKVERATKFNGGDVSPANSIVSIEPTVKDYALCITVDHPNSLYITDNFITTHNNELCCPHDSNMVSF